MTPRRLRFDSLESRVTPSIAFRFDYSLDQSGFFNNPEHRAALEQAGFAITNQLNDTLAAIAPGGSNSWTVSVTDPVSGQVKTIANPTIATDEILVYATAGNLPGKELAATGATSYSAKGSTTFVNTVTHRGQSTTITESSPWGGIVSFDTATSWYFFTGTRDANEYDFTTVAEHELMHILGFGSGNPEFNQFVSGGFYRGPNAMKTASGPIAVVADPDHGSQPDHWAPGTRSYGHEPIMLGDLPPGTARTVTALDLAALADLGWEVDLIPGSISSPPVSGSLGPIIGYDSSGSPLYTVQQPPSPLIPNASPNVNAGPMVVAVGAAGGSPPTVTGYDSKGQIAWTKMAFEAGMTAGVRVAVADFNKDGVSDLVVGTGSGVPTRVRVLDGKTGGELFSVEPFETQFTGGVFVAAGDVTGDGRADLAIAAGESGGPRVRVFGGTTLAPLADFFAIEDANFRGGARPVLADFTGDNKADLVVSAGAGGGPRIAVYDGATLPSQTPRKIINDFFGGNVPTSDGALIAAGHTNSDGIPDLVVSAGATVIVFDGKELGRNSRAISTATFRPPTADSRGGARIAMADVSGDGLDDILTFASLRATPTQIAAYSPVTRALLGYDLQP